jgi:ribosomal-protein-alanine N-acetyltransferase
MDGRYHIRTAEPGDVIRLVELERLIFPDSWTAGMLLGSLGPASVVAEAPEGGVVGYGLALWGADTGEIVNLAVHPAYRRRGLGADLVAEVCRRLEAAGVRTVYLEVRESNAGALAFYVGLGFREVGRRTRYYRRPVEDALVLERPIGAVSRGA